MHRTATFQKTYLFKVVLFTQSWVEFCGVGDILLLSMGSCRYAQGKEDYRVGGVRESLHRAVYRRIVQRVVMLQPRKLLSWLRPSLQARPCLQKEGGQEENCSEVFLFLFHLPYSHCIVLLLFSKAVQ